MEHGLIPRTGVWHILIPLIIEILPEYYNKSIVAQLNLKTYSANSESGAETIILTSKYLDLNTPLIQFDQAQNLKDLSNILWILCHKYLHSYTKGVINVCWN